MRELSETLLAAQRGQSARPCVRVTVDDRHVGVGRLRLSPVYNGEEDDGPFAMAAAGGYLLRARVDTEGQLRFCRTEAGLGGGWDAWAVLATGVAHGAQIALAAGGTCVYLLYVNSDGTALKARRSIDLGATWSAEETVHTAPSGSVIPSLAATSAAAHGCISVFVEDGQTSGADDVVHLAWWSAGAWTTSAWSRSPGDQTSGVAVMAEGGDAGYSALSLVVCGCFEDVSRPSVRLYHVQLTVSGAATWLYRGALVVGDSGSFTWAWPALVAAVGDRPRLFLRESCEHGTRLGHMFLLRTGLLGAVSASDLTPMAEASTFGAAAVSVGERLFVGSARWLLQSPVYTGASGQRQDVSADVVAFEGSTTYRGAAASERLVVLLDNHSGRYDHGSTPALSLGGQLSLRCGYWTAAGAEVVYLAPYWIGEIERSVSCPPLPGGQVRLHCYGGWAKLWRSISDRAHEWKRAPALVLAEALERFGFVYSDDGSPSLYAALTPPRFTLDVGESWGALVASVLDYSGCELRFTVDAEEEEGWPSARAHVFTPGNAVGYAFGAAQHPVVEAALAEREGPGMWSQVYGDGVFGEALDDAAISALGFAATRQAFDLRLNNSTDVTAEQAAGFLLQRYGRQRAGGWLVARPNVGQELLDVVSVPVGGMTEERRVLAIEQRYDRLRGVYEQRLVLGAV